MDYGLFTGVVFLDLKKAFHTVDHAILLRKLYKYSFSVNSIDWFKSYLTGRKQLINVNGVKVELERSPVWRPTGVYPGSVTFHSIHK